MTIQIPKSQISDLGTFQVEVQAHSHEMKLWRDHMMRVKDDAEKQLTPPDINDYRDKDGVDHERFRGARQQYEADTAALHQPYPPPASHPLVERAVNENYEPDFEIVDDGPDPEQVLAERRQQLLMEVHQAEERAINALMPFGKRRLNNQRENEIRSAEQVQINDVAQKKRATFLSKIGLGPSEQEAHLNAAEEIVKKRSAEDHSHLVGQEDFRIKEAAIRRASTLAMAEIEDLTHETIASWKVPELKS